MKDLVSCMNAYYGVGAWTYRTGVNQGSDIGPALTAGLQAIRNGPGARGTIQINSGQWLYRTPVSPSLLSGNYLIGEGSQASTLFFANGTGVAFYFNGAGGLTGGGLKGLGVQLEDGLGDSTAYAILLMGDASFQPDQMQFDDLYISALGASYWFTGFEAYGDARTAPQGIRVGSMHMVEIFKCRNVGCYLSNVVDWDITNLGLFVGKGGGMDFYITGGGTPPTNSTIVNVRDVVASNVFVPAGYAERVIVDGQQMA